MSKKKVLMANSQKFFGIQAKSETEADIFIYGVIGPGYWWDEITSKEIVTAIKDAEKKFSRINIRINSVGGDVFEGIAIYNTIAQSAKEIHTYIDGLAASMGSIIALGPAKKDNIHIGENGFIMIHSPIGWADGTAQDLRETADVLDKIKNQFAQIYTAKTGKPQEEIEKWMAKDTWMTAQEARDNGLVGVVEQSVLEAAAIKNMKELSIRAVYKEFSIAARMKYPIQMIEADTTDGKKIKIKREEGEPQVGDEVVILQEGGSEEPYPDGQTTLQGGQYDGWVLTIQDSKISEIQKPGEQEPADDEDTDMQARLTVLESQLQTEQAARQQLQAELDRLKKQPAARHTVVVKDKDTVDGTSHQPEPSWNAKAKTMPLAPKK